MEHIKNIIEALLFVADEPLSMERLKKILSPMETGDIRNALEELGQDYEARNGGFTLDEVAGGFQFRTRPEHNEWVKKLVEPKPVRLSKAALETLAIIAYKQPVIRSDIEHIRGVDSGGVIRALLERKMVRVLGRREIPGRPLIYATSKRFLEVFGLKDLKDLPTPKEIEEFGRSSGVEIVDDGETAEADPGMTETFEQAEPATAGDEQDSDNTVDSTMNDPTTETDAPEGQHPGSGNESDSAAPTESYGQESESDDTSPKKT